MYSLQTVKLDQRGYLTFDKLDIFRLKYIIQLSSFYRETSVQVNSR